MNQDLLRVFETESDYDSAKPDFVYPTVSYVRDVDEVRYMEAPKALLPRNIDTTGYATNFVRGQYYPQEALVFKAIYDMYNQTVNIDTDNNTLYYYKDVYNENGDWVDDELVVLGDLSNEPLYTNYISKLKENINDLSISIRESLTRITTSDNALDYSDGLYFYNGEA